MAKEVAKTEMIVLEELKLHLRPVLAQCFAHFLTLKPVTTPIDEQTLNGTIINALWAMNMIYYDLFCMSRL